MIPVWSLLLLLFLIVTGLLIYFSWNYWFTLKNKSSATKSSSNTPATAPTSSTSTTAPASSAHSATAGSSPAPASPPSPPTEVEITPSKLIPDQLAVIRRYPGYQAQLTKAPQQVDVTPTELACQIRCYQGDCNWYQYYQNGKCELSQVPIDESTKVTLKVNSEVQTGFLHR